MAGPSAWFAYDSFMLGKSDGTYDLDDDTFKVALFASTYTPNLATDAFYTGGIIGDEISGTGYTVGGELVAPTLTGSSGNVNFNLANPQWTAGAGNIVCRYAVIIDTTIANGALVAYCLLDTAPADVTVVDGNTLTIDITTNSVYDESRV